MTIHFAVNYLAVVVATGAAFAIGFIWYAPPVFGKRWLAYLGRTQAELGNPGPSFALAIVAAFVNAWVLGLFATNLGAKTVNEGIALGAVAWLGFMATVSAADHVFTKKPWGLWVINNLHSLLAQMVMAVIVTVWR